MTSAETQKQSTVIPLAVLLGLMLIGLAAWQLFGEPAKRRTAERTINAAIAACDQGGKQEFDRRMVEASLAIEDLNGEDMQIYEARLHNQLTFHGCK
jgi:hypothetical protein